ncbi:DUF7691 family protein [Chryseobacterium luquanense]|uniref:DUF7691 domain-containing protein n=1 Tax=Chryseobacterium luquanense TaxID=2983766 RepID=A0ABT3Y7U0_9FLAO|nr:hypothetical protein [Chryseobacterium luquanense]MCX8534239.1 hypothetical protein [Chryseobacterium luquanense]
MGYYVTGYVTDSANIKNLYGSKDQEILTSLLNELSDSLDELNDDFDFDDNLNEEKNSQAVLTDIINGEIRFPELAYLYGYVYEKLCEYFGEIVDSPNDEFSTNYYWEIPKETYKAFIPIPFSSDFPEVYSIYAADLQTEKSKFLALTERKGVDSDYLKTEKEDFEFAFNKAIKENKDLVFFLY